MPSPRSLAIGAFAGRFRNVLLHVFSGDSDQDIEHGAGQHLRHGVWAQRLFHLLHGEIVDRAAQIGPPLHHLAELPGKIG